MYHERPKPEKDRALNFLHEKNKNDSSHASGEAVDDRAHTFDEAESIEENLIYHNDNLKTYLYLESTGEEQHFEQKQAKNENKSYPPGSIEEKKFNKVNYWNEATTGNTNPRLETLLEEISEHLQAIEGLLKQVEGHMQSMLPYYRGKKSLLDKIKSLL